MSQITQIIVIVILSSLSWNSHWQIVLDCFFFLLTILHNTLTSFYRLLRHETSHRWQNTKQTSMMKIVILSKKPGLSLWWKQEQISSYCTTSANHQSDVALIFDIGFFHYFIWLCLELCAQCVLQLYLYGCWRPFWPDPPSLLTSSARATLLHWVKKNLMLHNVGFPLIETVTFYSHLITFKQTD